jgi:cytochrome c-type biogenesis protein CcmH/NrfF
MSRFASRAVALAVLMVAAQAVPVPVGAQSEPRPRMEGLETSRTGPLEDPALEARATHLADQLRCPVCQGLSIHDSPSPLAQDMKDLIRTQVAAGATDDEVRQYFISKYGEWVLLEPKASGFNLLVYVLPALALLGGAALIFVAVRRWTVPEEEGEGVDADHDRVAQGH